MSPDFASTQAIAALIAAGTLGAAYTTNVLKRSSSLPYPPGPQPKPLIGNLTDIPITYAWKTYHEWHAIHGDVVHLRVFGQSLIIIGSMAAAVEFFEKRSAIYSDRPRAPMINELMGLAEWSFANMSYGERWRKHRRAFHQHFNQNVISTYHTVMQTESHKMAKRLSENPNNFSAVVRLAFAAMIMSITYGIEVSDLEDEYISIADEATSSVAEAAVPGKYLVDLLPSLKSIPTWMPGAEFRRQAEKWRGLNDRMRTRPFQESFKQFEKGAPIPSVATTMINNLSEGDGREEEVNIARNATAVAYTGGTDTTVSATLSFFLAMALYPEIQKRAQLEIDSVVGRNRFPDYNDRQALPYINAICKETMRWQPVTPLGGAHANPVEDIWNGFYIPKDSIVIGNTYSILHNPKDFPQPDEFIPERFLTKDGQIDVNIRDPSVAAFGFGRRICPGRFFSDAALFSVVVTTLAAFEIVPGKNLTKDSIVDIPLMSGGAISHPLPFNVSVVPRGTEGFSLANSVEL